MSERLPATTQSAQPAAPNLPAVIHGAGKVDGATIIAPQVVFSLAQAAALSTYGVVGIASRYTGADSTQRDPHRGLEITFMPPNAQSEGHKRVKVEIYIIVQYGVRIPAVTTTLQHQIEYSIHHSTGYVVEEVHIHVAGMRVGAGADEE